MGLMNPHYSDSPLSPVLALARSHDVEKIYAWMEKKRGNRFSLETRDTIFPPVLIARIFLSRLPICTTVND